MANANVREVVIGGYLAELVSAAYEYIVEDTRKRAIKSAEAYQHRPAGFHTVPFAEIYSEDADVAAAARHEIYSMTPITPEMELTSYMLERAIQFNTVDLSVEGIHSLNGLIIFRRRGYGDGARKIRLSIQYGVHSNGNNYRREVVVLSDEYDCKTVRELLEEAYSE